MFDLKQLKYFIVCAETGSISEAAKLLYTTQPSVSKAIKALEEEMGIVLFERMPRGIALTVKGREAYRYACRIINDSRILEEMSHGNMAKYLRISLNPSSWFTNQFVEFYKEIMTRIIILKSIQPVYARSWNVFGITFQILALYNSDGTAKKGIPV